MSDPLHDRADEEPTAGLQSPGPGPFPPSGRYRIESRLGAGGMAEVYKAFDPALGRHVALKFLRVNDPALLARFQQEARAQARLEHAHICKVYEVGEADGRHFIAMQHVAGRTLKEAARQMTLEQKVAVVRDAADAVHAAHKASLIHRDIKPGNIMVERRDDGGWHAYVMDFGIARDQEGEGLTVTGMIVGTPGYAAPEQLRGREASLDRRADVYGLGATLYAVLTGRAPFGEEASVDVMMRVLDTEPPSLTRVDRDIPPDLDTVAMKCLQKEPHRRYESAKALAEDLQRYLDGEPILARRTSLAYRLAKKARKNRALVGTLSVASALLLLLGGVSLKGRWDAARKEELARRLGQEMHEIESLMRIAHLLPLHDTRGERDLVRRKMASIARDHPAGAGRGPAAYALGRGHLVLGDHAAARRSLEEAWKEGYRRPEVAHALGVVLGALYRAELQEAGRLGSAELAAARRRALAKEYREPALEYLRRSRGADLEAPEHLEALLAFHEDRHREALDKARAAYARLPWLYEARILEGRIHQALGDGHAEKGRYDEARAAYGEAEAAYRSAQEVGRSDPQIPEALAGLSLTRMKIDIYGEDRGIASSFEQGMAACDQALRMDPDSAEALRLQAALTYRMAEYDRDHGRDPRPMLARAVEAAERAAAARPSLRPFLTLIEISRVQAAYEIDRGIDPTPAVERAQRAYREAVRIDPTDHEIHNSVGIALRAQGGWEARNGRDPRPYLQRAIDAYGEAIRRHPAYAYAFNNAANAWVERASYELDRGLDPSESVAQARRMCEQASAINPNFPYPYNNAAAASVLQARYEMRRGGDPRPSLAQAVAAAQKGASVSASFAPARGNLARAHQLGAEYEWMQGRDPGPSVQGALAAAGQALALNPKMVTALASVAWSHLVMARHAIATDPRPHLARARQAVKDTLAANPRHAEAHLLEGLTWLLEAEWRSARRQPPAGALARAGGALDAAARIKADDPRVPLAQAEAALWEARWRMAGGQPAAATVAAGLAAAQKALALDPGLAEAAALRGLLMAAQARLEPPVRRADLEQEAERTLRAALAANRNLARRYRKAG